MADEDERPRPPPDPPPMPADPTPEERAAHNAALLTWRDQTDAFHAAVHVYVAAHVTT